MLIRDQNKKKLMMHAIVVFISSMPPDLNDINITKAITEDKPSIWPTSPQDFAADINNDRDTYSSRGKVVIANVQAQSMPATVISNGHIMTRC